MKSQKYLLFALVLFMFALITACGNSSMNSSADVSTSNAAATTSVQAQCTNDQQQSTAMQTQSTSIQEQNSTTAPGPWKLLHTCDAVGKVNIAGYLNEKFGVTAGYAGEMHYTEDGGTSWPVGTNQSYCRFGLDIADENNAWTCGNAGHVRKTADGGKTWTALADFGDSAPSQCRYIDFVDDKNAWIAAPKKLGSTTDGGKSWTEITLPDGFGKIAAISLSTPQNGYLLDFDGNLYITQDGAKTWTTKKVPLNGKIFPGTSAPSAAMHFIDLNNAVLTANVQADAGLHILVFKTVDGGVNWEQTQIPGMNMGTLYLSHDTKFITVYSVVSNKVSLFSSQD